MRVLKIQRLLDEAKEAQIKVEGVDGETLTMLSAVEDWPLESFDMFTAGHYLDAAKQALNKEQQEILAGAMGGHLTARIIQGVFETAGEDAGTDLPSSSGSSKSSRSTTKRSKPTSKRPIKST